MEQVRLGHSGLQVSRICLGTMTFGAQADEAGASAILDTAAEAGVTLLDAADVYPAGGTPGTTEEIVGRWLRGKRDQFVVATKCGMPVGPAPWQKGCSRSHILRSVDASLRRLGTDHVDLYQLHCFDPLTPLDETLGALDSLVRSGKVRHLGCSNWFAYQLALALGRSDVHDWERFVSVQPRYNLLHRPMERELVPLCLDQGVGMIPYNPLAGGLLTGKHRHVEAPDPETRFGRSPVYRDLYWREEEFDTVDTVEALAREAGLPLTTLAVAWTLAQPGVTASIIGASRVDQLADSLAAATTSLDEDLLRRLHRATVAHRGGPAI